MKAGGVKFADTPEEAEDGRARRSSRSRSTGSTPRGVLVEETRAGREGVLRRRHVGRAAEAAGHHLQRHGRHRHRGGRREASGARLADARLDALPPFQPYQGEGGGRRRPASRGDDLDSSRRSSQTLVEIFLRYDLTLAEINPLGKTDGRPVPRARRPRRPRRRRARQAREAHRRARHRQGGDARGAPADRVRDQGRAGRRVRPPRRRRQRAGVRRRPRARDRRRRRLAHALRRDPQARRQARELLRDRRQPEREEGAAS